jgi:hypothetical protein
MLYLLHFSQNLSHARHYLGFVERAEGLDARIKKHANGSGAKLTAAASKAGIEFIVARIWPNGDRTYERKLKNRKEGPMLCPVCNASAMRLATEQVSEDLTVVKQITVIDIETGGLSGT